jgi:hypothetical protein
LKTTVLILQQKLRVQEDESDAQKLRLNSQLNFAEATNKAL